jgi:superfamily II DNA or RNA helicase
MCDDFSDPHIRFLAKSNNISTRGKTKQQLCDEIGARLPIIRAPDPECASQPLARLKYQARELDIPNYDMYNQKTKQELCEKIRASLDASGSRNQYVKIEDLGPNQPCVGRLTTMEQLGKRARQLGIFGYGSLDRSTLCFLIRREMRRLLAGGIPREPLPEKKRKEALPNTYDRFVIEDEEKLTVPQLSRALTEKQLRAEQILPAVYLMTHPGMILAHAVGTGKTFAAINTSQVLLRRGVVQRVIVITPTSLQYNFIQQFQAYNKDLSTDPRYSYYTPQLFYNKVMSNTIRADQPTLLIIDEAHNYRSSIWERGGGIKDMRREVADPAAEHTDLSGKWTGNRIRALFHFMRNNSVSRVLLMTATPLVNDQYDLENLLALVENRPPRRPSEEIRTIDGLYRDSCAIHYYESGEEYKSQFPRVKYHTKVFQMSREYFQEYYSVQISNLAEGASRIFKGKDLRSFYNGVRRAANRLDYTNSDKLTALVQMVAVEVSRDPTTRLLVYSSWIEAGLKSLNEEFQARGIRCASITGSMSKLARSRVVDEFNSGGLNVLMISRAGGEGLDLKGARKVYIVDPTWNDASIQQIIGRAVRFRSHAHLPEEQRVVDVYSLMLLKPFEAELMRRGDTRAERLFSDMEVMGNYGEILLPSDPSLNQLRRVYRIERETGEQMEEYDEMMSIDLYLYKFTKKKQERLNQALDYIKQRSQTCHAREVQRIERAVRDYQPPPPVVVVPASEEIVQIRRVEIEDEDEKKQDVIVPQYRKVVIESDADELRKQARDLMGIDDRFVLEMPLGQEVPRLMDAPVRRFAEIPPEVRVKGSEAFRLLSDRKKIQITAVVDAEQDKVQIVFFYMDQGKVQTEKITL